MSGNAGILVTRVEYVKRTGKKNFLIVDAAMNDLIRPAFYDAYHEIVPLTKKSGATDFVRCRRRHLRIRRLFLQGPAAAESRRGRPARAVERGRLRFRDGDRNYNTRPLAAEILVNGKKFAVVRERQPVKEIWAGEKIAPWLR